MALGQLVASGGDIDVGKVSKSPCEYFVVVGFNVAPLGEPQSDVQNVTR